MDTKGVVVGAEVVVVFTARKEKIHSLDWHADYSGGLLDHRNKAYHQKAIKRLQNQNDFRNPPPHQIKIISYSCFLKHENRACHQEELNKILKSFSSTPIQKLKLYQAFNIMHFKMYFHQ